MYYTLYIFLIINIYPIGAKILPCNHIFHTSCLRSWFQRHQTCPTCRLDILRPTNSTVQSTPNVRTPINPTSTSARSQTTHPSSTTDGNNQGSSGIHTPVLRQTGINNNNYNQISLFQYQFIPFQNTASENNFNIPFNNFEFNNEIFQNTFFCKYKNDKNIKF